MARVKRHETSDAEIDAALAMVRHSAARILRIADYGIVEGARAELIVLDAETPLEALRLQAPRRWTIHEGRVVAETRQDAGLRRHPAQAVV